MSYKTEWEGTEQELHDAVEESVCLMLTSGAFANLSEKDLYKLFCEAFSQSYVQNFILGVMLQIRKRDKTCIICGNDYEGHGNNAEPFSNGRCCDECNYKFVIPARIERSKREA